MMGVPLEKVVVRLGDSSYPVSAGSGGQWGRNCSTAGVYAACVKLRKQVAQGLGLNAIYNATGMRDYPITLDKMIPHMPEVT